MLSLSFASGQPLQRVVNTTLRLPQNPPVFGLALTNAFPGLTINGPIAIASPPGETNRLFILERAGRVVVITNLAAPTRTVFMDISSRVTQGCEEGLLGIAFHPGYATNRYFFLFYSLSTNTAAGSGLHQRVSRYQTSSTNPSQGMGNSELPLFTQRDEACNHNGGDLHFGPDGYLYVSLGDEGMQNDFYNNSQRIDKDFFSGILRLDPDKLPGNLPPTPHAALMNATNYYIPTDNPFVGATNFNGATINTNALRAEFWAVGLRNPWRFSFDPVTSLLWCGDVGGGAREEVNIIVRGGNYGWALREGTINGPKVNQTPSGWTGINPIFEYNHGSTGTNVGNSITGGVVYRGNQIPSLTGAYIFADYGLPGSPGNVWSLRYDGTNVSQFQLLLVNAGLVAFGIDPRNGDVLAADLDDSQVKRLVYVPVSGAPLPPTLIDTGSFTNLLSLIPQAGIFPYDLNIPFWSDNAIKTRWFYIPPTRQITFRASNNWTFPTGSVWIKHFDLELTNGAPDSRRRLETRFIVRDSGSGVYGITYRWGNSLTNAALVPEEGMDETFAINDGGTIRTQVWHYPSRQECLRCHTSLVLGGLALGFNTPQLNREYDYGAVVQNQLRALNNTGYFASGPTNFPRLPLLAHPTNEAWSLEFRVRSYLAANCSPCHQPGGTGLGNFDTRITMSLAALGLVGGTLRDDDGDPANRVVVPGSVNHSMLLTRVATFGSKRMPPLDSTVLDTQAIALLSRWITNDLPRYQSFTNWQLAYFSSTTASNALATADADGDGAANYLEYLTGTDPGDPAAAWKIDIQRAGDTAQILFPQIANRGFELQWSPNLFDSNAWQVMDVPANRPFFSATNLQALLEDPITNAPVKFYRVRVYEP